MIIITSVYVNYQRDELKIINIGIANTSGLRDKKDIIQDNLIINYFIININFRYRLYFSYNKINYNKID